ncbi:SMP-30/gluconolactonase/LRE family protein [Oxalicibacterium faecigallinarum]|uniref:Gluconolactonase n=1 Tax=Oxalicibacterium faecigallinarum TaxID=573741 RepID=A0A8J3B005_9BURK|nr:SMP-30/gluconolactonase/LRE family protein [Oxalicibacterium faecigallinarum]GGI21089.1 gluconolactonase [Oxalicibacterium faecigallinarum]
MMENCQSALDVRMQLGECPLWHPKESVLYWVDIDGCAVHRFSPAENAHTQWKMPTEPGCIALRAGGGLLVALRSGLAFLDTSTGVLTMQAPPPYDPATTRFNDGRVDAAGRFWVGAIYEPRDQANAALYRVQENVLHDSGKRATVSNGLAFSPDNRTMYHSDTTSHRIFAYDYDVQTGTISDERVFHAFSKERTDQYGGRPDGGGVDSEGAYWAAMYEGGRLVRFAPDGTFLQEIALPVRCPTMMAFGGDDLRTLYITTVSKNRPESELAQHPLSGHLLQVRVDVPGLPEHFYQD